MVTRGIDNVDRHAVGCAELSGRGAHVTDRGVLGENGDALLALQIARIHDSLARLLHGSALAEGPSLPQHGINEGRLSMVNMGDDCDVT